MWQLITLSGIYTFRRTPLDEGSARRRDLWQHTTFTRDRHPWSPRDSNPHFQQARSRRPTLQTTRPPESNSLLWNRQCPKGCFSDPNKWQSDGGWKDRCFQWHSCSTCTVLGLYCHAEGWHFLWTASRIRRSSRSRWLLFPKHGLNTCKFITSQNTHTTNFPTDQHNSKFLAVG